MASPQLKFVGNVADIKERQRMQPCCVSRRNASETEKLGNTAMSEGVSSCGSVAPVATRSVTEAMQEVAKVSLIEPPPAPERGPVPNSEHIFDVLA